MDTSIRVGVWVSGGRSFFVLKLGERGGEQAGNAIRLLEDILLI